MANLRDIKRRIDSVKSTKQIARTMEMVSTAKIRKALDAAHAAEPYKDAISLMLVNVVNSHQDVNEPLLKQRTEIEKAVLIVIASDRGMAGGFNVVLHRKALAKMKEYEEQGIECDLITCGRKPTEYFTYRGKEPVLSFVGMSSEPTMEEADKISSYVIDGYTYEKVDQVIIYYQHARNRMEQDEVVEQLLPIEPSAMKIPNQPREREATKTIQQVGEPTFDFEPSASQVLGYLLPAYIRTVIYHALLDSAAAEHGARRRAMKSATDNATEIITTLSRSYNRIRQSSITTELNEIVGGAAALEED